MTLQKPSTRPNANLRNRLKIYSYKIVTNVLAKKLNDPIQAEKSKLREKFWGFRMASNTREASTSTHRTNLVSKNLIQIYFPYAVELSPPTIAMYGGGCLVPPLARDGVLKSLIVPLESFGDSNCARFISATWK